MTRYLTPAKIGLLCLIELYTDNAIPTASTIPILSFIIDHVLPTSLPKPRNHSQDSGFLNSSLSFTITIRDFEKLLISSPSVAGLPGRTLWDSFLTKLWSIDTLDALHVFLDRRSHLLARTHEDQMRDEEMGMPPSSGEVILLSRTSPFGAFVRRCQLEFARLQLNNSMDLWRAFIAYRRPTLPFWRKRNPKAPVDGWKGFDAVLNLEEGNWQNEDLARVAYGDLMDGCGVESELVSTHDVEKLLEFQVDQMQKLGTRIPEDVRDRFRDVMAGNVAIPSLTHYVSFLDAWRAGDYPTSFDSLHRFFDYTMQNRDRLFYQYALLNLAVLQADFGCYQEAVAAMQETVATARENNDMGCLNFSLSWLYHFGKAHPNIIKDADKSNMLGVEREGLAFLRAKAKESGMSPLWSTSLLSEAKMGLANGESIATAFENILRSSQITITKNLMNSIGSLILMQSAVWSRLGVTHLSWLYCETFLRCHSTPVLFDDILKFTCRRATLLTQEGKYDKAMSNLEGLDANSLRTLKHKQYYQHFRGVLILKRDLHHNHLDGADYLLSQLSQCPPGDRDLAFEIQILHIDYLMRRKDFSEALAKIEKTATGLKEDGEDLYYRIRILVLKALLYDRCGRPQKGFSIAVRAANLAWKARLLPALWQAMGALANILTSLSSFAASISILTAIIPRALEIADSELSAQLYSFLVDAYVGLAGEAEEGSSKRIERFTQAIEFIDRAFEEWSHLEDVEGQCELMAKKATIMHLVGDIELANDYAAKYLDLKKAGRELAAM